ncbi:MAG: motility protein A [Clostridiales bacterium]|nr:MAG: motility protein A [Clostridiales bacterium]
MQITVIGGLIFGFVCIIISILLNGDIGGFIDPASIFIVVGGVIASTLVAYPISDVKRIPKLMKMAMSKTDIDVYKDIDKIVELSETARKEGLLALENSTEGMDDPFLKNGVMLILDGSDPELVKNVMETELSFMADRHSNGVAILNFMSSASPAFGMIGTLIGLINMLATLSEMDTLGASMAVALVTTFYGCVLANLIFTPLARQLSLKSEQEQLRKSIIIEGILSIQDGENPRVIRDKLMAFVSRSSAATQKKAGRKQNPLPEGNEGGEANG